MITFLRFKIFVLAAIGLSATPNIAQTDTIPSFVPPPVLELSGGGGFTLTFADVAPFFVFPTIETVVEKFVEEYGFYSSESYYIEFEKRPAGYFVATRTYDTYPNFASREIFWSVADGQWKPLSAEKKLPSEGLAEQLIRNKYYYDRVPYYGYRGWYRDVIDKWEGKGPLTDALQFSLATAWYQRATALLSDQHAMADSVETFILPDSKNALSPEQLEVYLRYMGKSLAHYETLVRQNPDYETVVGPATVKLADQYMTAFMQLHYFQNEKTALKILDRPPLTFNEYLLESSRNLLRSCPKNAVLLTYGDNDTYPLWYVQAKQGFRRDVVVANLSLLATGRYINHLRDSIFDAPPLRYQISPEFYFSDSSVQVILGEQAPVDIFDFLKAVVSKTNTEPWHQGYPFSDANGVYFYTDKSGRILPEEGKPTRKGNRVELIFDQENYLIRDQLAVLDLLCSNTPERPLCFAATCRGEYLEPFEKHLRLQGLVYRFDPKPMEVFKDLKGAIDVAQSYRFFAKEMEHTSKGEITFDGFPYLATHKNYLFFTARELNKQGKKKKAAELLDRYFEVYPNDRVLFDRSMLYLAFAYADAGKLDKALAIVRQVLDNFEAGKIDWEGYEAWSIETIKSLAKESKDQDLLKRLEKY